MGEPAQRFGDANSGGGTIGAVTNNKVYVNSKLISIDGSIVTSHGSFPNVHAGATTANGSSTVKVGGLGVNKENDADSCGHVRIGGSSNVNIG
jgi:uncharacterized Zn-binding protein involved in type VI secretion